MSVLRRGTSFGSARGPSARVLLAALALAVALSGAWNPSRAVAGEYTARVCAAIGLSGEGVSIVAEGGAGIVSKCGNAESDGIHQRSEGGSVTGGQRWTMNAPTDTLIHSLELELSFSHEAPSFLNWSLNSGSGQPLASLTDAGGALPGPQGLKFILDTALVNGRLFCSQLECFGGNFSVDLRNVVAGLRDELAPALSGAPGGSLVDGTVASGVKELTFAATDRGSGIASAGVVVDGVEKATANIDNGRRCVQPYRFLVPCALAASGTVRFDTAGVADGRHEIQLVATDAAGNRALSAPIAVTTHNAPLNSARPLLSGAAKVGGRLTASTGTWENAPSSFSFQWFRCPPSARELGACDPIVGATAARYSPDAGDLGRRALVQVTATNAIGSDTEVSLPSEVVGSADSDRSPLTGVSLTRTRVRVGRTPAKTVTSLRLTSSRAGKLTILIERERGKKFARAGKLLAQIKAGRSVVPISGTVGGRRLRPGRYRVTVELRDPKGRALDRERVEFTVVPG